MPAKELRPRLDPDTCSICGRRLLQGEQPNHFVAPDTSRHVVCELCVPRAERVRWVREREGEEIVQLRPSHKQRGGLLQRVAVFFGAGEPGEEDEPVAEPAAERREVSRRARSARRGGGENLSADPELLRGSHAVTAVPTSPEARLERSLELFNNSQFPRTIAGLSRSLGDPKVAAANVSEANAVDVWVGWDLAWYSYRIALDDSAEPVEQMGRGNDVDELSGVVSDWNAGADGFGRLFLVGRSVSDRDDPQNAAS